MKKVLINGAEGQMGKMIADIIAASPASGLQVACKREGAAPACCKTDIVIDFSSPAGAEEAYEIAVANGAAFITGTTGLREDFIEIMRKTTSIPVFYAPNVSIGVYMFGELLKKAVSLYGGYEQKMEEIHHTRKKDAPSGTAKVLARATGLPEEKITSVREGDTVGTHAFTLFSPYEEITVTHTAKTRALFAESAVKVAAWLSGKEPGFYNMSDYAAAVGAAKADIKRPADANRMYW